MSGALKLGNLKLPRLGAAGILSGAGNAGPRRLAMLTVSVLVSAPPVTVTVTALVWGLDTATAKSNRGHTGLSVTVGQ